MKTKNVKHKNWRKMKSKIFLEKTNKNRIKLQKMREFVVKTWIKTWFRDLENLEKICNFRDEIRDSENFRARFRDEILAQNSTERARFSLARLARAHHY